MEAIWLAAVILTPLFFNVYSSRIFEPDKLTLLRSLALVALAAWLVKLVDQGGFRWENLEPGESRLRAFLRIPLVAPVVALVGIYLLATAFSVSLRFSLWGSYQRLQGTYTTFSYIVIFAALAGNLRRREQVERLITAVIFCSLPVSLYGVLQRYRIDPVPWGGDVTVRIASNMGNSIFVAAYLIMVFPLTAIRAVESFTAIMSASTRLTAHVARATAYVFIAALQVIALLFSGSRGPLLGWLAGSFFLFITLSLLWRRRFLTISVIAAALLIGSFLLVLNLENGPLESLRSVPGIGRLGHLLDEESKTSKVRTYIWRGASRLVLPHQPLEYPDGSKDAFNVIRPLMGYGPESMWVAYNPFYPPELTTVEKRNASPDRSHNETWDSLVITGALGLIAYQALFAAVFFYFLRWLGLIPSAAQRNLFFGLYFGMGAASAAFLMFWKEPGYVGVGLPFGSVLGMLAYLTLVALSGRYQIPQSAGERLRALTLLGLLAAVVAHYVEINFGIAIAVTRTYFWTFSGLSLVVGYVLPKVGEYRDLRGAHPEGGGKRVAQEKSEKGKKRRHSPKGRTVEGRISLPDWLRNSSSEMTALVGGFVLAIALTALGYDFLANPFQAKTAGAVIWNSLVRLRSTASPVSYGVLAMILTASLIGSVLLASESEKSLKLSSWLKGVGLTLGVGLSLGLIFWLWHAASLAALQEFTAQNMQDVLTQVGRYETLLTRFYLFVFFLIFGGAVFLPIEWPLRVARPGFFGVILAPFALGVAFWLISYTNLRVIQADIAFKAAEPFSKQSAWPAAIGIYNHANALAPNEDFYYLFLGRAYLEYGRTLSEAGERERFFTQAMKDLQTAQTLNPLNIDHTANLARLYSLWAAYTSDPKKIGERNGLSDDYFSRALTIAPNNSRLWDEWALLYLNNLKQPAQAFERLSHSLELDPYYDWTYALMGDYYTRDAKTQKEPEAAQEAFRKAADNYSEAIQLALPRDTRSKFNYTIALAGVYIQVKDYRLAIASYENAIRLDPKNADLWRVEDTLARLYHQNGDKANAVLHAERALAAAPDTQKETLQKLVEQLKNQP
jgi:tetratricopeptide (TPR) repeat protein